MSDATLHTEIEIAAPPERVWEVLTDFDRWAEWNPMLAGMELRGPFQEGTAIRLQLDLGSRLGRRGIIGARLITVRKHEEIAWEGGLAGVMLGRHGLRLVPIEIGTRVVHTETFTGALSSVFIRLAGKQMMAGYRGLNKGLRRRCEQR